jgi:DNA-binding CsgD family transcriptional regulator
MKKLDLLSILEAGYAVESAEEAWLGGLLEAARPSLDEGLGSFAFSYSKDGPKSFELRHLNMVGVPDAMIERIPAVIGALPAAYIQNGRTDQPCTLASEIAGFEDFTAIPEHMHPVGAYDALGINVAFRMQRRFAADQPAASIDRAEAVLDRQGKVHHATGPAELAKAREALRAATLAMERARDQLRSSAPEDAVGGWKGLVDARWSLVDHFESDGKHYILAHQNDAVVEGPAQLSPREKQVLAFAALGHHSKLIAYELGISDSTVRVLLARASAKLGARNREEAIAAAGVAPGAPKKRST